MQVPRGRHAVGSRDRVCFAVAPERESFERQQVWFYLAGILVGLFVGTAAPSLAPLFATALWPLLGTLLYATFTQVPLTHLPEACRDLRFMTAVLTGNFIVIPVAVWGLLAFVPADPAIRLGVLLVLLVPCTDWFITFTHLAGGDTGRAIAVAPVNLLAQMALLPLYLWFFMGEAFIEILAADRIAAVFALLIVLPLLTAWFTERWAEKRLARAVIVRRLGWLPVPLLTLVVFLIAASQVNAVIDALPAMGRVVAVFTAFLAIAIATGMAIARIFALPLAATRTLIFSLGTRNSFVVLPLALALAARWRVATVVIVLQSLVELLGMVAYLWIVPRLVPARAGSEERQPV